VTLGLRYRRLTKKTLTTATTTMVKSVIIVLEKFSLLSLVAISSTLLVIRQCKNLRTRMLSPCEGIRAEEVCATCNARRG